MSQPLSADRGVSVNSGKRSRELGDGKKEKKMLRYEVLFITDISYLLKV